MEKKSDAIDVGKHTIDKVNWSIEGDTMDVEKAKAAQKQRVENPMENPKLENLPLHLIHQIMHSLPTKEVTKLSVLSKAFNSSWLSFPVFDFDYDLFQRYGDPKMFFSFIEKTLQLREPHIKTCLQKLRFSYKVQNPFKRYNFDPVLDVLLSFALQNKCQELDIEVSVSIPGPNVRAVQNYFGNLSDNLLFPVFTSNFLTVLKFTGLKLLTPNSVITCPTLKELIICTCGGLQTITVSSSSLQQVHIIYCNGLKGVRVEGNHVRSFKFVGVRTHNALQPCDIDLSSCKTMGFVELENAKISEELMKVVSDLQVGLLSMFHCDMAMNTRIHNPNLKIMEIKNNHRLENLVLSAPNLECLEFQASRGQNCTLDISACVSLTVLIVKEAAITDEWVKTTMSRLGCLEDLQIFSCNLLERTEFRNENLETLLLSRCSNLKEAMIDARNLIKFSYCGSLEVYPMLILSSKCSAIIELPERKSDQCFEDMRRFLSCFDHFKQLSISCISPLDLIFSKEFMSTHRLSPLNDMKHVILQVKDMPKGPTMTQLVESLLWLVPKPKELTLESTITKTISTIKFKYLKKVKREEVEVSCCSGLPIKCWRNHALKIDFDGFEAKGREDLEMFFAAYME